ncbi:MAG: peptidase M55 [Spirochaetaceae bacterium]|nr:MAG: peptidase M55 [Spirochaetaceae bacterium]
MKYFVSTDLEGPCGVDRWGQVREGTTADHRPAMDRLALETNACIAGIRAVDPSAEIDVWDGHGSGGLVEEAIRGARYIREPRRYLRLENHDALLFVGQHAMAGTYNAPLCHTFSSRTIAYYRLNDVFIGEFAAMAFAASLQGTRTIFLSGDDKAVLEAKQFVPDIRTTITKYGLALELANHRDGDTVLEEIRENASNAVLRMTDIPPVTGFRPPYTIEVRYIDPVPEAKRLEHPARVWLDERTYRLTTDDFRQLPI